MELVFAMSSFILPVRLLPEGKLNALQQRPGFIIRLARSWQIHDVHAPDLIDLIDS